MQRSLKNGQIEKDASVFQERVGVLQDLSAQVKKAFEEAMNTEKTKESQQTEKAKSRPLPASFLASKPSLLVRQVPRKTATPAKKLEILELRNPAKESDPTSSKQRVSLRSEPFLKKNRNRKEKREKTEIDEIDIQGEEEPEQEHTDRIQENDEEEEEEEKVKEEERKEEKIEKKAKSKVHSVSYHTSPSGEKPTKENFADSNRKYFRNGKVSSSPIQSNEMLSSSEETEWVELNSPLSQKFFRSLSSETPKRGILKNKTTSTPTLQTGNSSKSTKTATLAPAPVSLSRRGSLSSKKQVTEAIIQNKTKNNPIQRKVASKGIKQKKQTVYLEEKDEGPNKHQEKPNPWSTTKSKKGKNKEIEQIQDENGEREEEFESSEETKHLEEEEKEEEEEEEEKQKEEEEPKDENENFEKNELGEEEDEQDKTGTDEEDQQTEKRVPFASTKQQSRSKEIVKKNEKVPRFTIEHAIEGTLEESRSASGIPRYRAEVWMDNGPSTKKYKKKIFISVKNWTEKQIRARVLQDQKIREQKGLTKTNPNPNPNPKTKTKTKTKTSSPSQPKSHPRAIASPSRNSKASGSRKSKSIHSSITL